MAGVTKCALEYEGTKRAWSLTNSNTGLRPGPSCPAFQVYDGSTADDEVLALTFFTLADPSLSDEELGLQCAAQLGRRMNSTKKLESFKAVHVQRWPQEKYISDEPDPKSIHPHPSPVPILSRPEWEGRLLFAGTESDLESPGVMEGAVGAAQRALASLLAD